MQEAVYNGDIDTAGAMAQPQLIKNKGVGVSVMFS
jgi:hypothetical protein